MAGGLSKADFDVLWARSEIGFYASGATVQCRVQFLDDLAAFVKEMHIDAAILAACRTESFQILGIVENGRFRLPWRFDLAALAPSGSRDRPLSIAVHRAPGQPRGCRPRSGRGEDEHSLQIPGHRHQTPFAANFIEPAQ